jgi:hypothetical protein
MPHLVRWHDELSRFGVVFVGLHYEPPVKPAEIKARAEALGVKFLVAVDGDVRGCNRNGPHCLVFDHRGKCVFSGRDNMHQAEKPLRAALGAMLADGFQAPPKSAEVSALLDGLQKGQAPGAILEKAVPLLKSTVDTTADEARQLVANLTAEASRRIQHAEKLKESEPVDAYLLADQVASEFKDTPVAIKAAETLAALHKDPRVAEEMQARPALETIRKLDATFRQSKPGPRDPQFKILQADKLKTIQDTLERMKKTWPETKATQEAAALCEKYGVVIR